MVECTGLENRRPFTGLASSNLALSANWKNAAPLRRPAFFQQERGAWTNLPEFDEIAWSDFGRAQRARRARARTARVYLALSANWRNAAPLRRPGEKF